MSHTDSLHIFTNHFLDALQQLNKLLLNGFMGGFFFWILKLAKVQRTLRHILEFFAFKLHQVAHQPFINTIGEDQHFDGFFLEDFQMRTVDSRVIVVSGDIINGLLAFLEPTDIVIQ